MWERDKLWFTTIFDHFPMVPKLPYLTLTANTNEVRFVRAL